MNRTWIATTQRGTDRDQLGRALWNLLAPLHGEPPCYAPGESPWPALDLADTDAVTGLLPHANLGSVPVLSVVRRASGDVVAFVAHDAPKAP